MREEGEKEQTSQEVYVWELKMKGKAYAWITTFYLCARYPVAKALPMCACDVFNCLELVKPVTGFGLPLAALAE